MTGVQTCALPISKDGPWASCSPPPEHPLFPVPTSCPAGEASVLPSCRDPWAGCSRRGFRPHWRPCLSGETQTGTLRIGGQRAAGHGPCSCPEELGLLEGRCWVPRGEIGGGSPEPAPCAARPSARGPRRASLGAGITPSQPGDRRLTAESSICLVPSTQEMSAYGSKRGRSPPEPAGRRRGERPENV